MSLTCDKVSHMSLAPVKKKVISIEINWKIERLYLLNNTVMVGHNVDIWVEA